MVSKEFKVCYPLQIEQYGCGWLFRLQLCLSECVHYNIKYTCTKLRLLIAITIIIHRKTSEECKGGFLSITKGKQEPNLSCSKNANIFCGHPTSLTDVKKFGPGESVTIKFFIAAKKNNKGFKFIVDYRKDGML